MTDLPALRAWIEAECRRAGYAWFTTGDLNLNVVAIRTLPGRPNAFDDTLTCSYREDGAWRTDAWTVTTDPGRYWLQNPSRASGTARIKRGQYRGSHVVGRHKDRYPALVQDRPVTVWRDADRDGEHDATGLPEQTGVFGINIHASDSDPFDAADPNPAHPVEKWSAGCIVFSDSAEYRDWWSLVTRAARLWGSRFTLTVLERTASAGL